MSDGAARFAARYPVVWHVIEAEGAGPWLAATGLLPAATLLRMAGIAADGANRDHFRPIALGDDRVAILRQQVMADRWLAPTLAGAFAGRPEAWRGHIDSHVFFWTEERRRDAFIGACIRLRARDNPASGRAPPSVLALDTAALLARRGEDAFFARFNTGSTVRGGGRVRRDETTLARVTGYRSAPAAELAIRGCVQLGGLFARP
jgi:hypothetical protein